MKTDLTLPAADSFGFVKTLNNQGFMTSELDEFSLAFVEAAAAAEGWSLDVGAAYGVATLEALRQGARIVANDLDGRHLEILKARAPQEKHESLRLLTGAFPELPITDESLECVLVCRVLHFFEGDKIRRSFQTLHQWLKPGGLAFIVSETPYVGGVQPFIPEYERRVAAGEQWPGWIADFRALDPIRGKDLPESMHLLDEEVLKREGIRAGFKVLDARKFGRPRFPENLKLDGRESVGAILRKPIR
jgi:SAM-dependent methyltransferase